METIELDNTVQSGLKLEPIQTIDIDNEITTGFHTNILNNGQYL